MKLALALQAKGREFCARQACQARNLVSRSKKCSEMITFFVFTADVIFLWLLSNFRFLVSLNLKF